MNALIDIVMLVLIVSNLLLLGLGQIRSCIRMVAWQGPALGLLVLLVHEGSLVVALVLSAVTIGLKGIVFPRLLISALRDTDIRHEVEPYVGHAASVIAGFGALALSAWWCMRHPLFGGTLSSITAPVSFYMIFVGLFVIVSRRKAISQILGYLVMENGIYVFGVVVLRELPLLVDLGVLLDAFAAVFVMGLAVYHIKQEFDHMDVDQLDMLKG